MTETQIIEIAKRALKTIQQEYYTRSGNDFVKSLKVGYREARNSIQKSINEDLSNDILAVFDKLCNKVTNSLVEYSKGNIAFVFRSMTLWWSGSKEGNGAKREQGSPRLDLISNNGIVFSLDSTATLFRMRKGTIQDNYGTNDMFAVPFKERRRLGNYRYSVSGYPCLYAGLSLYICWEELRRPTFDQVYATSLKLKDGNTLNLFDLRLIQTLKSKKEINNYICMLPLILACSVAVPQQYDKNEYPFKLEYAFPQFLMNALTQKERYINGVKMDGIIYTSTRCKGGINKIVSPLCDNIAIPIPSEEEEHSFARKFDIKPPVHIGYSKTTLPLNSLQKLEQMLQNIPYESL